MRVRLLALAVAFALGTSFAAASSQTKTTDSPPADKASAAFIKKAIEGNFAEIKMGELAQQNAQSDGVKAFGKMLMIDHDAANDRALTTAKTMGVAPPSGPNAQQTAEYNKMQKLKGAAFDKAFVKLMIADHKKAIKDYQRQSKKTNDPAGQYATTSLATLQKHLDRAQSISTEPTKSSAL